jgi:hypothetical protein
MCITTTLEFVAFGLGVFVLGQASHTTESIAHIELNRQFEERMMVLSDTAFHAAAGDPPNLPLCRRGAWNDRRLLIETGVSMLTVSCHCKKGMHRVWASLHARLPFTLAALNVLGQWHGLPP